MESKESKESGNILDFFENRQSVLDALYLSGYLNEKVLDIFCGELSGVTENDVNLLKVVLAGDISYTGEFNSELFLGSCESLIDPEFFNAVILGLAQMSFKHDPVVAHLDELPDDMKEKIQQVANNLGFFAPPLERAEEEKIDVAISVGGISKTMETYLSKVKENIGSDTQVYLLKGARVLCDRDRQKMSDIPEECKTEGDLMEHLASIILSETSGNVTYVESKNSSEFLNEVARRSAESGNREMNIFMPGILGFHKFQELSLKKCAEKYGLQANIYVGFLGDGYEMPLKAFTKELAKIADSLYVENERFPKRNIYGARDRAVETLKGQTVPRAEVRENDLNR
jgi:hypothetical protein